jgi:hypothetical protein
MKNTKKPVKLKEIERKSKKNDRKKMFYDFSIFLMTKIYLCYNV